MKMMSLTSKTIASLALLSAVIGFQKAAQAGDVLRFKQGVLHSTNFAANPDWLKNALNEHSNKYHFYVVQFASVIKPADEQQLVSMGAKILRYIPDDGLLVEASPLLAQTIAKSFSNLRIVVPFFAQWKASPEFGPASILTASQSEKILIRLFNDKDNADITSMIQNLPGAAVNSSTGRSIQATVPRQTINQIAGFEGVEWLQPQPEIELMSFNQGFAAPVATPGDYTDLNGYEPGTKVMNFNAAWARGYFGEGQTAAMADTGLDTGDITTMQGDFKNKVDHGYSFGLYATGWDDPMGHGTHVAGSVVSDGAVSGGKIQGGAHKAKFIPEGMWSPMLSNLTVPPNLSDLFTKAYNDGARIHTNSWGAASGFGAYDSMAQQADEFMFNHQDLLILFAAGNSGADLDKDGRIDPDTIGTPGTAKNVLTVGASKNLVANGGIQKQMKDLRDGTTKWGVEPIASSSLSENAGGLAAFSSRGPTSDGRIKPEIVAPGTNILSVRSHVSGASPLWGPYNDNYAWSGGTSMATPLTAGAATVVREYLVKAKHIANPSAAMVKAVLLHTATDLFPGQFGEVGKAKGQELLTKRPNSDEGYGRVDMDKATNLQTALLFDEATGLGQGEEHRYPVQVTAAKHLIATLVYTDAPGSPSVTKALVNKLDVSIVDSSGKETKLQDDINNTKLVQLEAQAGHYEVVVRGTNIPQGLNGKQPFALVVTVE